MISQQRQDEIVEEFRENGFAVARGFLEPTEVAEVIERLERYVREIVPRLPDMDVFYETAKPDDGIPDDGIPDDGIPDHGIPDDGIPEGGVFEDKPPASARPSREIKMLSRMQDHDEYFKELLEDTRCRALGDGLWGVPVVPQDIACFDKPALHGEPTPAHQDGYYFIIEPCEAVTLWLALDRVDEENGCLYYVRGSHRRGMRPHARTSTLGFSQGITNYPLPDDLGDEVMVTAEPGDLILHDGLTVHRAGANQSRTRSRRALGLVYFSERARKDPEAHAAYQKSLAEDLRRAGKI